MPLEVDIAKKLREFTLEAAFVSADKPLGILGPSGAGKTMLLRCIAGLERPDLGRIVLNGRVLFDQEKRIDLPARERRVGLLFQQYALFPHRTVAENISFAMVKLSPPERQKLLASLIDRTHISGLERRYPHEVSGGEQQRTALARALAIEPQALLLDEPLSALDTHLRSQIEQLLQETFAAYERPSLLVTHNIEEAYRLGERLMVISRGRLVAFGDKEKLFRHPPTVEVAQLTGCKNISRARAASEGFIEALDWGCQLRVSESIPQYPFRVGIRAHHVDFVEEKHSLAAEENIFPCWLAGSSETPFRVTLFLSVNRPPRSNPDHQLRAEVYKEKWQRFRAYPFPWQVRLAPEYLFLMRE